MLRYERPLKKTPGHSELGIPSGAARFGSANGIRTRVSALRGRCPRPLDDSAGEVYGGEASFRTKRSVQLFSHGPLA